MRKNIYDILNDVNTNLNNYTKEEFTHFEKRKYLKTFKKNRKSSSIYKKYISIACIVLLITGILTTNISPFINVYANIIVNDIASLLGIERNISSYKTIINQPITKKDITIQLNEAILNNDELIMSTTIKSKEKINIKTSLGIFIENIYINGKLIQGGISGGTSKLNDYTLETIRTYKNIPTNLNGDVNIKYIIKSVKINDKTINNSWVFKFKTNGDELLQKTKSIPLNYSFTLENGQKITLNKYTSNDIEQIIYFTIYSKFKKYDILLKGADNLGNKITFYTDSGNKNKGKLKLSNFHGNLNPKTRILTLTPYYEKLPEKSGKMSGIIKKCGSSFTIDLEKLK